MLQQHILLLAAAALGAVAQTSETNDRFSHSFTGTRSAMIHCTEVLHEELPKLTGAPEPDDQIEELAVAWARGGLSNADDNCELPNMGGPDAAPFSSWASSFASWRDDQVTIYQKIYTACSELDEPQPIPTESGICSTLVAKITGGSVPEDGDDDNDSEGGGSSDDDDNDDGDDGNSSSQLTGMGLIGAAAIAGIIAAVAL